MVGPSDRRWLSQVGTVCLHVSLVLYEMSYMYMYIHIVEPSDRRWLSQVGTVCLHVSLVPYEMSYMYIHIVEPSNRRWLSLTSSVWCSIHVHVHGNYPGFLLHAKLEFLLFITWYRDTCLALYCLIRPTTTELPR